LINILVKRKAEILVFILTVFLIIITSIFFGKEDIIIWINKHLESLLELSNSDPLASKIYFFFVYIFLTSLSLPVAFILGLLSGMLFDIFDAVLIVSFASSIGATIAFLTSRFLFKDYFQKTFGDQYTKINKGFIKNGAYYLYAIRMTPIFPYFIVNLTFGLTTMKTSVFYIVTQIGMLPITVLVALTGKEMLNILTTNVGFNSNIVILLILLGLLPLIFKHLMRKYL
tara:strand:+ start:4321 stop:5004 length:684 start_codon:yes stop_codon:yes gene_type:complete